MASSWFGRLLALFIVVPVAELALLVWLGGQIGFWPTVGLIVLTALVGSFLAQREGLAVWNRVQRSLQQAQMPSDAVTDGLVILVAGAFLLTPGVLTDVTGFLGLFPPTRAWIKKRLAARFKRAVDRGRVQVGTFPVDARARWDQPPVNEDDTGLVEEVRPAA